MRVTHGITQTAQPPWTMTCFACQQSWDPERTTDNALNREAAEHWKTCPERGK